MSCVILQVDPAAVILQVDAAPADGAAGEGPIDAPLPTGVQLVLRHPAPQPAAAPAATSHSPAWESR